MTKMQNHKYKTQRSQVKDGVRFLEVIALLLKWLSYNWWTLSHTHTHTHINTLTTPTTNKFKLTRYERQYTLTHIHKYQRYFYERERTNLLRPCRRKRTRVFLQSKAKVVFCVFTLIQNESKLLTIYDLRYPREKLLEILSLKRTEKSKAYIYTFHKQTQQKKNELNTQTQQFQQQQHTINRVKSIERTEDNKN